MPFWILTRSFLSLKKCFHLKTWFSFLLFLEFLDICTKLCGRCKVQHYWPSFLFFCLHCQLFFCLTRKQKTKARNFSAFFISQTHKITFSITICWVCVVTQKNKVLIFLFVSRNTVLCLLVATPTSRLHEKKAGKYDIQQQWSRLTPNFPISIHSPPYSNAHHTPHMTIHLCSPHDP